MVGTTHPVEALFGVEDATLALLLVLLPLLQLHGLVEVRLGAYPDFERHPVGE